MVKMTYDNTEYDIQLTRRALMDVEEKFNYSFLRMEIDSLSDLMKFVAMVILAGTRKSNANMSLDKALDIADAFVEEKGFEDALNAVSAELEAVLNPKKGVGKKK